MIGISGARSNRFTHSQFHSVPSLLQRESECYVDVNPLDAGLKDIVAGELLKIETPRGHVCVKARISEAVHPGSVRIAWGWGELNPDWSLNNLTDDGIRNVITCTPSNRSSMCRIEKVAQF